MNEQSVAGLTTTLPRVPITAELLTTLTNAVLVTHGGIAGEAAAGNFAAYSMLNESIIHQAVADHNVDARTISPAEVARELYPRLALPGLHLNQPEEDRVREAILNAVSFGATLGVSLYTSGGVKSPAPDSTVQQSYEAVARLSKTLV